MDILRTISGIEVYPVLSLTLFVTVFCGVLLWALRTDPARLDALAALPLDDGAHTEAPPARPTEADTRVPTGERRIQ